MLDLDKLTSAVQCVANALQQMKVAGASGVSVQEQAEEMEEAISNLKNAAKLAEEFSEQYYDNNGNIKETV